MKNISSRSRQGLWTARILSVAAPALIFTAHLSQATQADDTSVVLVRRTAGATPFIRHLLFRVNPSANLQSVQFTIQPKAGSVTRPISATYSSAYLSGRGFLDSTGNLDVPIFGLYEGSYNTVILNYTFRDNSSKQNSVSLYTAAFRDPCKYKEGIVAKARSRSTSLSYDFMLLKNSCGDFSPAFMDTDGALRWVGAAGISGSASAFIDNAIYIGNGPQLFRIELDGAVNVVGDYSSRGVTNFHHNIDPGKRGLLLEVDTTTDLESVILEVSKNGSVLKQWNLAKIIANAMRAGGDDPSAFVRRGEDWFHNNAATYRASDDSLILSSRENFVIALDYTSGAIKWILGDFNKAWYQYASLRRYALTVPAGGVAPIGQHSVSITYNDNLLLFDDGLPSFGQNPPGISRQYAAPRKYSLNLSSNAAREIFSYERSIVSEICSSVYEDAPDNYLIDYSVAGGYASGNSVAEITGLQANGAKVFDYKYPTHFCDEIFNAFPIHLENLSFDKAFVDTTP